MTSRVLDEYLQGTSGAVEFWKSSLLDIKFFFKKAVFTSSAADFLGTSKMSFQEKTDKRMSTFLKNYSVRKLLSAQHCIGNVCTEFTVYQHFKCAPNYFYTFNQEAYIHGFEYNSSLSAEMLHF